MKKASRFLRVIPALIVVGLTLPLAMTEPPVPTVEQTLEHVREAIREEGPGLPEPQAQQEVAEAVERLSQVKSVRILPDGATLDDVCSSEAGMKAGYVYLVFPSVASQDAGIYGGFYALSSTEAALFLVLSPLAEGTDPRAQELLDVVDGSRATCP